jgi:hypothetical protein
MSEGSNAKKRRATQDSYGLDKEARVRAMWQENARNEGEPPRLNPRWPFYVWGFAPLFFEVEVCEWGDKV